MLKKLPRLKSITVFFDSHKNIKVFSVFNSLGKWKVFARVQIHLKKILKPTNKTHKAGEKYAQGA